MRKIQGKILLRDLNKARALLGNMDEDTANKKVVSVLYLSLGEAARKLFKDNNPKQPSET